MAGRLTGLQKLRICELHAAGVAVKVIADRYGIDAGYVSRLALNAGSKSRYKYRSRIDGSVLVKALEWDKGIEELQVRLRTIGLDNLIIGTEKGE